MVSTLRLGFEVPPVANKTVCVFLHQEDMKNGAIRESSSQTKLERFWCTLRLGYSVMIADNR